MKKTILPAIIALAFFPLAVDAQCDITTEKDEFTGKTTAYTKRIKISYGGTPSLLKSLDEKFNGACTYRTYLTFIKLDGKILMLLSEDSDGCLCVPSAISFKFSDGQVLTKANSQARPETKTALGEEKHILYQLTKEELLLLSQKEVEKIRITEGCSEHPTVTEEFDTKTANSVRHAAFCLNKELN